MAEGWGSPGHPSSALSQASTYPYTGQWNQVEAEARCSGVLGLCRALLPNPNAPGPGWGGGVGVEKNPEPTLSTLP